MATNVAPQIRTSVHHIHADGSTARMAQVNRSSEAAEAELMRVQGVDSATGLLFECLDDDTHVLVGITTIMPDELRKLVGGDAP